MTSSANTVTEYETWWRPAFTEAGIPAPTRTGENFMVWSNREAGESNTPGETYQVIIRIGTDGGIEFDPTWISDAGPDKYFAPMRFDYIPHAALALATFLRDPSDACARFIYANRRNLPAALEASPR